MRPYQGNDVLIGGMQDFDADNRDFAFGHEGDDILLWEPGDGEDFFDGGQGKDVLIVSRIMGSVGPPGNDVLLDSKTGYPIIDINNTPGYCEVTRNSVSNQLNPNYLITFKFRNSTNCSGKNSGVDEQMRVHLEHTEFVVCPSKKGRGVDVFDLRRALITKTVTRVLPAKAYRLILNDSVELSSTESQ